MEPRPSLNLAHEYHAHPTVVATAEKIQLLESKRIICVVGAGAYGSVVNFTAMAAVAATNGHEVRLYARDAAQVAAINLTRKNPNYLKKYEIPANVMATTDAVAAITGASLVILALPAQRVPGWLAAHKEAFEGADNDDETGTLEPVVLCSTAKGLYLPTRELLSKAIYKALGVGLKHKVALAVLSGPSFAQQIVEGHPTAVVVASKLLKDAVLVQFALSNRRFRVYASQDVVGVELGGALKNPLALGAGMLEGGGYGINTMAAYVTRAARELSILCVAYGGTPETIAGLAGVGDLMLTAFGDLSRNRNCGIRLARGEKLEDILATATVEGIPTAEVAVEFAERSNLELPIFQTIQAILTGKVRPNQALELIMARPLGPE